MEELEGHVAMMACDWDAEDIDPYEDDGNLWVPMMPQMMRTLKMPRDMRSSHLMTPVMPLRQMAIYMVQPN